MTIRIATPADVVALAALKRETFAETFLEGGFAIPYPPADLAAFIAASYGEDKVAAELADSERRTWVAEGPDGTLLGYAQIGPCKLPHADVAAGDGELYQLYIRRAGQGAGLGRALLREALDHLAIARPGPVWLGVWSGNARAQAFYQAEGFRAVGGYDFLVGAWTDAEYIYRRG